MNALRTLKDRLFPPDAGYSLRSQFGYCAGIFGNCMGQDTVDSLSDKFCRQFMGIRPNHMTLGGNLMLAMGFLAGSVSGYILDTPVKKGRRSHAQIFIAAMPIPFAIATILLYVVPTGDPFRNFLWMLAFRLLFRATDSFYDASLNTLSLRAVDRIEDRKSFYTVGTFASALGSMLPEWLVSVLVGTTKALTRQQGYYFKVTLAFSIIGVMMMFVPFFTMEEKVRPAERSEKQKVTWDKQILLSMLHNRSFLVVECATLFEQIRQIPYKMLPYVYEEVLGNIGLKGIMDPISGTLSYLGLAMVPSLTRRLAPRTLLSGGFAYTGVFYTIISLFGLRYSSRRMVKSRLFIGLLIALAGLPNNAIAASKRIVVGDSTDYMEWYAEKHFGRPIHAEGFISAAQSMLGSVFDVIRTNIYNVWFGSLGYMPSLKDAQGNRLPQSIGVQKGIFRMFVILGVAGNFCAAIIYLFDNYHGKRKETIEAELAEMRARRQLADARAAEVAAE